MDILDARIGRLKRPAPARRPTDVEGPTMASLMPVVVDPPSRVQWTPITLTDKHKGLGELTFTFPKKMEAFLTRTPPLNLTGSAPDGTAPWWRYFQQRHKDHGLFWVQGHMLNDRIFGPGTPNNLVPICSYLNTMMETMVEKVVKNLVEAKQAVLYVVEAHWEVGGPDPTKHMATVRERWGLIDVDAGGALYWGEQFAPSRLSWKVYKWNRHPITNELLSTPLVCASNTSQIPIYEAILKTYKGSGYLFDDSQYGNQFPSAPKNNGATTATVTTPTSSFAMQSSSSSSPASTSSTMDTDI